MMLFGNNKKIAELTADRDEWKQQHENLLSVRDTDLAVLAKYKAALEEITTLTGTTLNFGVARFIACQALNRPYEAVKKGYEGYAHQRKRK
jgi:hypothetical protein